MSEADSRGAHRDLQSAGLRFDGLHFHLGQAPPCPRATSSRSRTWCRCASGSDLRRAISIAAAASTTHPSPGRRFDDLRPRWTALPAAPPSLRELWLENGAYLTARFGRPGGPVAGQQRLPRGPYRSATAGGPIMRSTRTTGSTTCWRFRHGPAAGLRPRLRTDLHDRRPAGPRDTGPRGSHPATWWSGSTRGRTTCRGRPGSRTASRASSGRMRGRLTLARPRETAEQWSSVWTPSRMTRHPRVVARQGNFCRVRRGRAVAPVRRRTSLATHALRARVVSRPGAERAVLLCRRTHARCGARRIGSASTIGSGSPASSDALARDLTRFVADPDLRDQPLTAFVRELRRSGAARRSAVRGAPLVDAAALATDDSRPWAADYYADRAADPVLVQLRRDGLLHRRPAPAQLSGWLAASRGRRWCSIRTISSTALRPRRAIRPIPAGHPGAVRPLQGYRQPDRPDFGAASEARQYSGRRVDGPGTPRSRRPA